MKKPSKKEMSVIKLLVKREKDKLKKQENLEKKKRKSGIELPPLINSKEYPRYVKWKNPRIYKRKCEKCGKTYYTTQLGFIECPECWASRLGSYDPDKMLDFVENLLSNYTLDQEFKVKCPKCKKLHLVSKRALFRGDVLCINCRLLKMSDF